MLGTKPKWALSWAAPNWALNQAQCQAAPHQHRCGQCCIGHCHSGHCTGHHRVRHCARLCCTRRNHTRHNHRVALGTAAQRAAQGAPLHQAPHHCPTPDHCPTASPCTNTGHPTPLHPLCTIPLFPPIPPQHCTVPLRVTLCQVCTLLAFTLAPCASRSLGRCTCAP